MNLPLLPSDVAETCAAIAGAAADGEALEIVAGGSKRKLGRPPAGRRLDISRLAGIVEYDACELVITAGAATKLSDITAALAERRQVLAFEPPDWRGLLAGEGEPTLGGVIACNASGPRRVRAGAARDHFLGFAAIDGRGGAWRAGGRVVKNVTGYDMSKLMAGAFGTLSVLTEISVRTVPMPESEATLVIPAACADVAVPILTRALNAPLEVSGAAWLPGRGVVLRLEGIAGSVAWRTGALRELLGGERMEAAGSAALWREIGEVAGLLPVAGRCVWRVCCPPAACPAVLAALRARFDSAAAFLDWGGGLLWLSLDRDEAGGDAGAAAVREAIAVAGGHATLFVAPAERRDAVFEPMASALAALQARIKRGFDPDGILNPRRMHAAW